MTSTTSKDPKDVNARNRATWLRFIHQKRLQMREDLREAETFAARWEALKGALTDRDAHLDVTQQRQNMVNNVELKDIRAGYDFFRERHDMFALHILAEVAILGSPGAGAED